MNTSTDVFKWLELPLVELIAWHNQCQEILQEAREEAEKDGGSG